MNSLHEPTCDSRRHRDGNWSVRVQYWLSYTRPDRHLLLTHTLPFYKKKKNSYPTSQPNLYHHGVGLVLYNLVLLGFEPATCGSTSTAHATCAIGLLQKEFTKYYTTQKKSLKRKNQRKAAWVWVRQTNRHDRIYEQSKKRMQETCLSKGNKIPSRHSYDAFCHKLSRIIQFANHEALKIM